MTPGALRAWGRAYHREAGTFVAGLDRAALERKITFPWAAALTERPGAPQPATLEELEEQEQGQGADHRRDEGSDQGAQEAVAFEPALLELEDQRAEDRGHGQNEGKGRGGEFGLPDKPRSTNRKYVYADPHPLASGQAFIDSAQCLESQVTGVLASLKGLTPSMPLVYDEIVAASNLDENEAPSSSTSEC